MEIEEYIKNPVYIRIHFLLSAYLQHDSFAQKSKAAIRTVYYVLNNAVVCTNTDGNVSWYCFSSGIKKVLQGSQKILLCNQTLMFDIEVWKTSLLSRLRARQKQCVPPSVKFL